MAKSSVGNPNHYPKGHPRAGQFAPKDYTGGVISHVSPEETTERNEAGEYNNLKAKRLRELGRRFFDGEAMHNRDGKWEVGRNDKDYEVSYDGTPVFGCVNGEMQVYNEDYRQYAKEFSKVSGLSEDEKEAIAKGYTREEAALAHLFGKDVEEVGVKPYKPAETKEEAEEYARELGVKPYYKGLSLEAANACNESLYEHFRDYPYLRDKIKVVGSGQEINREIRRNMEPLIKQRYDEMYRGYSEKTRADAAKRDARRFTHKMTGYAYYVERNTDRKNDEIFKEAEKYTGIYLNEKFMKSQEALDNQYRHDMEGDFHPKGTEHNAAKSIIDHEMGHALDLELGAAESREFRDGILKGQTYDSMTNGLSRYATANPRETIAEGWAEYRNSKNPRELAVKIGRLIERMHENHDW